MQFRVESDPGTGRLRLIGELDLSTVGVLLDAVEMEMAGRSDMVLDFSKVTFIDSVGLHALVRITQGLGGGRLHLVDVPPLVSRVLDLTGLRALEGLDVVPAGSTDQP